MTLLLDTSLWTDFTRTRSPVALKQCIAANVIDPAAHAAHASGSVAAIVNLSQACRQIGRTVLSHDLLIAAVALHHNAKLVSFEADFLDHRLGECPVPQPPDPPWLMAPHQRV